MVINMQDRPRGNEYRTTVVCIDSYEDSVLVGRFFNPAQPEGTSFHSTIQFLIRMEDLLNEMRYPQSFVASRSFQHSVEDRKRPPSEGGGQTGKLATFAVRILFRQSASWQGSITWLEGDREESFRSVLELILLMDSALKGN